MFKRSSALFLLVLIMMNGCHPAFAYDDIIQELENYVDVRYNTTKCRNDVKSDAWYLPSQNVIHFCKDNIIAGWPQKKHDSIFRKVLLHEAVHLAQDCKAGLNNNHLTEIGVNTHVPEFVAKRYPKHRHIIEAEAFHYWHKGNKPLELVKKFC